MRQFSVHSVEGQAYWTSKTSRKYYN